MFVIIAAITKLLNRRLDKKIKALDGCNSNGLTFANTSNAYPLHNETSAIRGWIKEPHDKIVTRNQS